MRRHLTSEFLALVCFFALIPLPGYGQSQSPAPASQPPASSATDSQAAQGQTSPAVQRTPARVWTNDEIDVLRNDHSVSVVGKQVGTKNVSATSKSNPQEKDPAWYRKQLVPLQTDIDRLDAQIAKLRAFLSGENVSETGSIHRNMTPTPQDQLKQMETKRQADVAKMDDLLDRARHNGIAPGDLR